MSGIEKIPGAISAPRLKEKLERLLSIGLRPASLLEYLQKAPPGPDSFTVSFDDAHPSVQRYAVPILQELRVPATVFVPTAYVGETDWVMSWEELRKLAACDGWVIGSHASVHQRMSWRLYQEDPTAQTARLLADVENSRAVILKHLGIHPDLFAYPFGEAPDVARRAVKEAGFHAAFTVDVNADWNGNLLGIPRVDGNPSNFKREEPLGISVIIPACDRIPLLHEVVRRLWLQSYPQERFEVIVVDDGSKEDLQQALTPYLGEQIRIIRLGGSDSTYRAGQARQAGSEAARFEVLCFLDSDVAVDQDYLWHVAWSHAQDPNAVVFGYLSGYNLHDLGQLHRLEEIEKAGRLTGESIPVIPDRSREPALRSCLDNLAALPEPWKLAYTGNLSVSKTLLKTVGGFSKEFTGWGFEDVDLGLRLHLANAHLGFSRFALGYHLADPEEQSPSPRKPSRNPFRDPHPTPDRFISVKKNLEAFEARHPGHCGVKIFYKQVHADIHEILNPPKVVGVEMGSDYPFAWPFKRLHKPHPGGLPFEEILDRLAYAHKLGIQSLYLLGGDVALRSDLTRVLKQAVCQGIGRISMETTAIPLADTPLTMNLKRQGLTSATVEILAGAGHPLPEFADLVFQGVSAMREAGLELGAKLVLGENEPEAFQKGLDRVSRLHLPLYQVTVLNSSAVAWVRSEVGDAVEVEVV